MPATDSKLVLLRKAANLKQRELAQICGRSVHTIRAIEQGHLNLSEELAQIISRETGVAFEWLRGGEDGEAPWFHTAVPPDSREEYDAGIKSKSAKRPYNEDLFRTWRSARLRDESFAVEFDVPSAIVEKAWILSLIIESAFRQEKGQMALYDLSEFESKMIKKYGASADEKTRVAIEEAADRLKARALKHRQDHPKGVSIDDEKTRVAIEEAAAQIRGRAQKR